MVPAGCSYSNRAPEVWQGIMDEYIAITVTSTQQLRQYDTIRLKSWQGDYLHRPDGPAGVTTWPVGELVWGLEATESGRFRLKSWKGDYLHRPDGPPAATTWPEGELEWTVEVVHGNIRLKSWKGDYLCRPDPQGWLITADSGGIDWTVERKRSAVGVSDWQSWLDVLLSEKLVKAAGLYGKRDGSCWAASPGLQISAAEAMLLGSASSDISEIQRAGALIAGVKYLFLTTSGDPRSITLRRGSTSCLVVHSLTATIVVLTVDGANPVNMMIHAFTASKLIKSNI